MAAGHLLLMAEAFALGVRGGADPATLYTVIKESSGYSKMMDLRLQDFLLTGCFQPGFKLDLMRKDVNLALDSARILRIPMMLTSTVGQIFTAASTGGNGDLDFSVAAQYLASMAGVGFDQASEKTNGTERVRT
jgi:3-hydroxyisobutyrate dehydrogenase